MKNKRKNRIGSTKHMNSPPTHPEYTTKKLLVTISMIFLVSYFNFVNKTFTILLSALGVQSFQISKKKIERLIYHLTH